MTNSSDYLTLQTDGTTKFGQHFATYDIGDFTLGIRHVFSGSAQNTLDTLIEILDDLDTVGKQIGNSETSKQIISKIENTMSDRHAAEKLFSQYLAEYRESILPDVIAGWNDMTTEEYEQITRMNNFYNTDSCKNRMQVISSSGIRTSRMFYFFSLVSTSKEYK